MDHFSMEFTVKAETVADLVVEVWTRAAALAGHAWSVSDVRQKYKAEQVEADEQTYHAARRYEVQGTFTADYRRIEA